MTCRKVAPLVDRLFVDGKLPAWRFRRMWRHLGACESCRAYYDRAALAWRAMGPGAEPRQVAHALADEIVAAAGVGARRGPARLGAWLVTCAGALAAILLAVRVVIPRPPPKPPGGEFTERGTAPSRARGLRAFCLDTSGPGEMKVRAAATSAPASAAAPPSLRCRLSDDLQLAYTLGEGEVEYLTVVGRGEGGLRFQYEPAPGAPSTTLRPGVIDEPLAERIHLATHHRPGRFRIEALYSRRPLDAAALSALLERGEAPAGAPTEVSAREEIELEVEP